MTVSHGDDKITVSRRFQPKPQLTLWPVSSVLKYRLNIRWLSDKNFWSATPICIIFLSTKGQPTCLELLICVSSNSQCYGTDSSGMISGPEYETVISDLSFFTPCLSIYFWVLAHLSWNVAGDRPFWGQANSCASVRDNHLIYQSISGYEASKLQTSISTVKRLTLSICLCWKFWCKWIERTIWRGLVWPKWWELPDTEH